MTEYDEALDAPADEEAEEAAVEEWLAAQEADEAESVVLESPPEDEIPGVEAEQTLAGLDAVEKVYDLPSTLADQTLSDVDQDDLDVIADIEDPQEQLEAYRAAGYPDNLLEVVSGADGRIVRVTPIFGDH